MLAERITRWPFLARTRPPTLFAALQAHWPARVSVTRPTVCPRCQIGALHPPENGQPYLWCVRRDGRGCGVVLDVIDEVYYVGH